MLRLLFVALALAAVMLALIILSFRLVKSCRQKRKKLQFEDVSESCKSNNKKLGLIATKLDYKLKTEKMFTNPELSIQDLAAEIGTNRSYVSSTINNFYNQNFCSYINHYRFQELADIIVREKDCSHKELATKCGFGSVDSMKRTVKMNTGLSMKEWKDYLTSENNSEFNQN